jgi:hypothetical protein
MPGLETPTPRPASIRGRGRLLAATAFCLATVIGVPWYRQHAGSVDPMTGNRPCGDAPSEIQAWTSRFDSRRAEDADNLRNWIARHPGRVNDRYGASCDTPLHLAARFGREDSAAALLAAGADIEARNSLDERPLHVSAAYGRPAVVKLLLARGADVKTHSRNGNTPLHAAACGHGTQSNIGARIEVATLLLAAGADVNARKPGSGFTPLRYAMSCDSRNAAMANLLFSHGADPRGVEERPAAARKQPQ